jgi:hypothetical protein
MKTLKEFTSENLNAKDLLATEELSDLLGGGKSIEICLGGNCTMGNCTMASCTMGSCTMGYYM